MKLHERISRHLVGRTSALLAAGLVLGLGMAAPADSLAGPGHGHRSKAHKQHVQRHHHRAPAYGGPVRGGVVMTRPVPVPRVMVAGPVAPVYRPYYAGVVYSRAHRHYHSVYDFPVYVSGGWVVRPHHYCDGHIYGRFHLGLQGDGFSVSVGW